jgi:hypothetical protein
MERGNKAIFADDMILLLENRKQSTKKLTGTIKKFKEGKEGGEKRRKERRREGRREGGRKGKKKKAQAF